MIVLTFCRGFALNYQEGTSSKEFFESDSEDRCPPFWVFQSSMFSPFGIECRRQPRENPIAMRKHMVADIHRSDLKPPLTALKDKKIPNPAKVRKHRLRKY